MWKEREIPDPIFTTSQIPSNSQFLATRKDEGSSRIMVGTEVELWLILEFSPPWQAEVWSEIYLDLEK